MFVVSNAIAATAPVIEEEWVSAVTADSAIVTAKVNPETEPTTYRFEYASSEAMLLEGKGTVVPTPPSEGDIGNGKTGMLVRISLRSLLPHAVYWYRVVTTNAKGEATLGCESTGTCHSFTTQSALGNGQASLDGRAWELVSPATKDGALIFPLGERGAAVQAAENGNAITYVSVGGTNTKPNEQILGNAIESQILSLRASPGVWKSQDMATPNEADTGFGEQGYRWFSPNLSLSLVEPPGSQVPNPSPLSSGASESTIYLRNDEPLVPSAAELTVYNEAEQESEAWMGDKVGYVPLVTGCTVAGCRTHRVEELADALEGFAGKISFVDSTPDGRHVIIESSVPLIENMGAGIYEWTAGESSNRPGHLNFIGEGVLGGGGTESVAARPHDMLGAISNSGSRVVYAQASHLFMREVPAGETIELDKVENGISPGTASARFQFAGNNGDNVFFSDGERLTANSGAEASKPDLYECEVEQGVDGLECQITDMTKALGGGGAGVQGIVASSSDEDAYLYVVATGVLTEEENGRHEKAKSKADNLYLLHYNEALKRWDVTFIAGLASSDSHDWGLGAGGLTALTEMTVRVSPDGQYLVFMSDRSLTGFDNKDAISGEPDEEVYLYHAPMTGSSSGQFVCVSCNPTGERPTGVLDSSRSDEGAGLLVDEQNVWGREGRWLAGSVPGWTAMALSAANDQSRYLSNSGKVFFDSPDPLVSNATNGLENVYEYEPNGVGSCGLYPNESFSKSAEGCIALISSGKAREESAFMEAGATGVGGEEGEDVFFLTSQPLVQKDHDTAFDVYDAHQCSAAAPCATEDVAPPSCTSAEACRSAPMPQPSLYGAPASVTFVGEDNPPPSAASVVSPSTVMTCGRNKIRSRGRCIARRPKRSRDKGRKRRTAHKGRKGAATSARKTTEHERRTGR